MIKYVSHLGTKPTGCGRADLDDGGTAYTEAVCITHFPTSE